MKSLCLHGTVIDLDIKNISLVITDPPLFNDYNIKESFSKNNVTNITDRDEYNKTIENYFYNIFLKTKDDSHIVLGHLGKSFKDNNNYKQLFLFFENNGYYFNEIILVRHRIGAKKWFVFSKNNKDTIQQIEFNIGKHLKKTPFGKKFDYVGPNSENTIKFIIDRYSKDEDIVLDPFGGSGTVMCVAAALNRYGINIEIEKEIHDFALSKINDLNYINKIIELPIPNFNQKKFLKKEIIDAYIS